MYPVISVNLSKLVHNALWINKLCHAKGIEPYIVTKGIGADMDVIEALFSAGITKFADSRLQNLKKIRQAFGSHVSLMMIRTPLLSEAEETAAICDVSLNSEWRTLAALGKAAAAFGVEHRVILMAEMGDLREGVLPESLPELAVFAHSTKGITCEGIGANFTCFSGVIPTEQTMKNVSDLVAKVEAETMIEMPVLSGGNSSTLPLLLQNKPLGRVNQLRIGEAVWLGKETAYGTPISGLYQDAFTLSAEIIEIQTKPTLPRGLIGVDAFGRTPEFHDRGDRLRAIVAIGRQDIDIDSLAPIGINAHVLGGSSDHLILDITDAAPLNVGDTVDFSLGYGALQSGMLSPFIKKKLSYDSVIQKAIAL
ncbi:alanine/ornithine racemase family PLP-dependent enzyme [Fictibacillus iocasae]|uniref:Alanine/ornithine racemase family PLP-dependent enzyme n=1 Tax=Fictibacillus iocasae TaxID=2715437 RepID=A0ABW2NT89_9BACL